MTVSRPLWILVCVALLALTACESKSTDTEEKKTEEAEKSPEAPEPTEAPTGEAAPAEAPAEPEVDPQERDDKYASQLCGYQTCYDQFDFSGQTTGKLTAEVGEDGTLSGVSFEGDAPPPVQTCLQEQAGALTIAEYVGGTGTAHCSWTGTLSKGGGMVQQSWGFERKTEPAP